MIDDRFHEVFKSDVLYEPTLTDIRCRECGTRLKVYYAENGLYAVKCGYCDYIALVRASNPTTAMRYFGEFASYCGEKNKKENQ